MFFRTKCCSALCPRCRANKIANETLLCTLVRCLLHRPVFVSRVACGKKNRSHFSRVYCKKLALQFCALKKLYIASAGCCPVLEEIATDSHGFHDSKVLVELLRQRWSSNCEAAVFVQRSLPIVEAFAPNCGDELLVRLWFLQHSL